MDDYEPIPVFQYLIFIACLICCVIAVTNYYLVTFPVIAGIIAFLFLCYLAFKKRKAGLRILGFSMMLCAFTVTACISYQDFRIVHLRSLALTHAATWLDMLKDGKVYECNELMNRRLKRLPADTDLYRYYGSMETPSKEVKDYLDLIPEKYIRGKGDAVKIRQEGVGYQRQGAFFERFEIHYFLDRSDVNEDEHHFVIGMLRTYPLDKKPYWSVGSIVNLSPRIQRPVQRIETELNTL